MMSYKTEKIIFTRTTPTALTINNIEDKFFDHLELIHKKKIFLPGVPQRP